MELQSIPFTVVTWDDIPPESHAGVAGSASWKVVQRGNVRARIVEYTAGYIADHWCEKGHVVYVLEGEFVSELKDGRTFTLRKGMTYLVADHAEPHRSSTNVGVKLLIID